MCEELFPDAVQILDYYHLSENVNDYAKFITEEKLAFKCNLLYTFRSKISTW